ncbi:MAG TPA: TIGR03936 family radical SAM-associated protein [Frankiaceae bacterium]|nr:TIGR03936 family radical SAM-associated protein [Frankiaceae bacterium]
MVARVRLRFAKRGRLRFTSHRDVARAFERAIRRAGIPMAYSSGFTPHPRISWAGAAPTGAASEAEYVELGLAELRDPDHLARDLDAALAPGIDVIEAVLAVAGTGKLAERLDVSVWELVLHGIDDDQLRPALDSLLAATTAPVERLTKDGRRTIDVRGPLVSALIVSESGGGSEAPARVSAGGATASCAILKVVVQQTTPVVRPDDVVAALTAVASCPAPISSLVTRMAQGRLMEDGSILDPLTADRDAGRVVSSSVASQER